jgi:hypothetical protein
MQHVTHARDVATGMRETSDEPASHWIRASQNNNWDCFGDVHGGNDRIITTSRYDGINFKANELSGEIMVSLGFAVDKAPFNHNVLSIDVSELVETLPKRFIVDPETRA